LSDWVNDTLMLPGNFALTRIPLWRLTAATARAVHIVVKSHRSA
jgi:hypothetical protein